MKTNYDAEITLAMLALGIVLSAYAFTTWKHESTMRMTTSAPAAATIAWTGTN